MKKIIPSILLIALASSSFLLAQAQNRLEATNQVIGYRLQVVGANQAADQTVGRRRTELPLEDQIRQRTETTTNCELRTANCNNSAESLNCYLMMNPSIQDAVEDAEEIIKRLSVTVHPPSQQTIQLNHTVGEQSGHFIQSVPPQEVGSERLKLSIGKTRHEHSTSSTSLGTALREENTTNLASTHAITSVAVGESDLKERGINNELIKKNSSFGFLDSLSNPLSSSDEILLAKNELAALENMEAERQQAIQLGRSSKERTEYRWNHLTPQARKMEAEALQREASKVIDKAYAFHEKALNASEFKKNLLWNEAIQARCQAEKVWAPVIEIFKRGANLTTDSDWMKALENVENEKSKLIALATFQEAKQVESGVAVALREAEGSSSTNDEQLKFLWNEVIQKSAQVEAAWTKTVDSYKKAYDQALDRWKSEWNSALQSAENEKTIWTAKISWYEAQKAEGLAEASKNRAEATEADEKHTEAEIELLWNATIDAGNQAEVAWVIAAEAERKGLHQTLRASQDQELLQIPWKKWVEEAENKQRTWAAQISWYKAQKAENLAEAARGKAETTEVITKESVVSLWDEAFQKRDQAEAAWVEAIEEQRKGLNQTLQSFQYKQVAWQLQAPWIERGEEAENKKRMMAAQISWYEAQKAASLAEVAKIKAITSKNLTYKEISTLWNDVIQQANEAITAWVKTVEDQRNEFDQALERLKTPWMKSIKTAESLQTESALTELSYQIQKAENLVHFAQVIKVGNHEKDTYLERRFWSIFTSKSEQALECWLKASNLLTQATSVNQIKVSFWKQAAEQLGNFAAEYGEIAQAYALEDKAKEECLHKANNSTAVSLEPVSNCSIWSLKAEEALEKEDIERQNGNLERASLWKKVAEQQVCCIRLYSQAARALSEGKAEEGLAWNAAGDGFYWAADKLGKAIKTEVFNKSEEAVKWREAAEKQVQSVEPCAQAARAYAQGKKEEGKSWLSAGYSFYWAADKLIKAIEAEVIGKSEVALKWREAAEQEELSIEPYTQAARSYAQEKTEEGMNWLGAGSSFGWVVMNLEKAIEADAAGNPEEAMKWREAAEQYKCYFKPLVQAARSYAEGKTDEAARWKDVGNSCYYIAVKVGKAIEAEGAGKPEEALKWRQAAEQQKCSVEPFTQAVNNYAEGKTEEGKIWLAVGSGLFFAADKLGKAIEAEIAGKPEVALKWHEIAEQYKRSVDPYTHAVRAYAEGKKEEAILWYTVGNGFYFAAEKLGKAIEAEIAGKSEEALKWREVAEQYKCSVEPGIQAVRVYTEGKIEESTCWNNAGKGFFWAAHKLGKAIEAEEDSKPEEALKWCEVAEQNKLSVDPYTQAAIACSEGKKETGDYWSNAGHGFYCAAENLGKAIAAEVAGKPEEALKWREAAEQYKYSVESRTQAVRAYVEGKTEEGACWNVAGSAFHNTAVNLGKAIEAELAGKSELALKWREAAEQYKCTVEPYAQAARAYAEGKKGEAAPWTGVGGSFYFVAEKLGKAIEAELAGKSELALKWREAAEQYKCFIEPCTQAVRAYVEGKVSEGNSWAGVGNCLQAKIGYQIKAIEAEETEKETLAADYREVAKTFQRAADHYKLAIQAYAEGKEGDGNTWAWAAISLKAKADYQTKEYEAQEAGKTELAAGYQKAAETSQRAADQWKESTLARAEEPESECKRLWQAARATQEEADEIAKKAEERG